MRTAVKLCGMRRPEDVEACAGLALDAAGFILVPGRKRTVTPQAAADLTRMLPRGVASVGVMADPSLEEAERWWDVVPFDRIQLHGDESPQCCRRIKELLGVPVIKVIHVGGGGEISAPGEYVPHVDAVLLDSGTKGVRGGTGCPFAWETIPALRKEWQEAGVPVWIAGGLHPGNVGELLERFAPDGVDSSSGVESDGRKDGEKMAQFVERVRNHDRQANAGEKENPARTLRGIRGPVRAGNPDERSR